MAIEMDSIISRMEIKNILDDLRRDEALRLRLYLDSVGKATIGYGHNIEDLGISENIAELILEEDFTNVLEELDRNLPWWRELCLSRRRGLVNMAFNLGLPRLLGFKKMLAALKAGDGELAAQEALDSKWAHQVHGRAIRVANLYREE